MSSMLRTAGPAARRAAAAALAALLACAPAFADPAYRWLPEHNLIVVQTGGATPSSIKAALPQAPLTLVDGARKIWLLGAHLLVTSGGSLKLYGSAAGGDVDELRLKSDNTPASGAFVSITADYGYLDIRATRITSWDTAAQGPDTEYAVYGRAFIRARSRLRSMMLVPLQSRMDIADSEIQYLGYAANESYGLVWKVVAPEPYVFDQVRVYGSLLNSRIHDNYMGAYASGLKDGVWRGNEVYHNVQYGLAPHNRSDDLAIVGNDIHHNGNHGITVRQGCARAVIRNNRVWDNAESGVSLHRGSNDALVTNNRIFANGDSGILVYDSARALIRDNVVRDNRRAGVQLVMGTRDTRLTRNEIGDNGVFGVFVGRGKGRPVPPSDGQPRGNVVAENVLYGSGLEDLRLGDGDRNALDDNARLVFRDPGDPDEPATSPLFTNPMRAEATPAAAAGAPARRASRARAMPGPWISMEALLWCGALALVATLLLLRGNDRARH